MLLNFRQFSFISFISLLLANPALAGGGNLSVSPDQGNETPQIQLENGGDKGMKAKTMEAETQQVMSQANAVVDPNSSVIFEVPLRIETDGTLPEAYDRNTPNDTNLSGRPIDRVSVTCHITDHDQGPYTHYIGEKIVSLDQDGDFNGTVSVGVVINENTSTPFTNADGSKRGWRCYMAPFLTDSNRKLAAGVMQGGAHNHDDTGTFK